MVVKTVVVTSKKRIWEMLADGWNVGICEGNCIQFFKNLRELEKLEKLLRSYE